MVDPLDDLTNILSILAIGVGIIMAIFGVWLSSHLQKKGIIKNSLNAIKTELEDANEGLKNDKKMTFIKNGEHYYRMTLFDTGSYESIVHSGYFIQLEKKLQTLFTEIYNRIKLNNDIVRYLETLEDKYAMEMSTNLENFEKVQSRYKERLVLLQKGIEEHITKVLEVLSKKTKNS